MTVTLFHAADLHLSQSDAAYGLAVLDELIAHCARLQPDLILLCGDIFDTHADAQSMAEAFSSRLRALDGLPVVMIPGNHEFLGAPPEAQSPLDPQVYAPAQLVLASPVGHITFPELDLDVLAVPFRREFSGYLDWPVPAREFTHRVGLLHGVVNSMSYTGESDEAEHSVIDPHLLKVLQLDYAALGHIHRRGEAQLGSCLAHYPGSARVWRKGETGARHATLVTLEADGQGSVARTEAIPLAQAGTYRVASVTLDPHGALPDEMTADDWATGMAALSAGDPEADWVVLKLEGFVESAGALLPLRDALQRAGAARFRQFEIDAGGLLEAEKLAGHPVAQSFHALWRKRFEDAQNRGDEREQRLLRRARELTLEHLMAQLAQG